MSLLKRIQASLGTTADILQILGFFGFSAGGLLIYLVSRTPKTTDSPPIEQKKEIAASAKLPIYRDSIGEVEKRVALAIVDRLKKGKDSLKTADSLKAETANVFKVEDSLKTVKDALVKPSKIEYDVVDYAFSSKSDES